MKNCKNCGSALKDTDDYCSNCGAKDDKESPDL